MPPRLSAIRAQIETTRRWLQIHHRRIALAHKLLRQKYQQLEDLERDGGDAGNAGSSSSPIDAVTPESDHIDPSNP
jgi:hypothetical protein